MSLVMMFAGLLAVEAQAKTDCIQDPVTQLDITRCAYSMEMDADARLNAAFQELLRYVEGDERAKLVAAQRAWVIFRDRDCEFFSAGGGSIAPMNRRLCRANLSNARAKELDSWPPNVERSQRTPLR